MVPTTEAELQALLRAAYVAGWAQQAKNHNDLVFECPEDAADRYVAKVVLETPAGLDDEATAR